MTSRDELRRTGAEMREKLGFPTNSDDNELAPGLNRLAEEMVWGSVWSRPGLILEDRMLAALSAMTSQQRGRNRHFDIRQQFLRYELKVSDFVL